MLHFGARQYTGHRVFENNSSLASGDFFIKLCRLRGWSATLGQFQYTHDPHMPPMRKRDEIAPPDRCMRPLNSSPVHAYVPRFRHILRRSEEHTSELQSLMRISYSVFR